MMEIKDQTFLNFPDNGNIPDDQLIYPAMKMGTFRTIINSLSNPQQIPKEAITKGSCPSITTTGLSTIEPKVGQTWVRLVAADKIAGYWQKPAGTEYKITYVSSTGDTVKLENQITKDILHMYKVYFIQKFKYLRG